MTNETARTPDENVNAIPEQESSSDIIEMVIRKTEDSGYISGIVVGTLNGFDASGAPVVDFSVNPTGRALPSRCTVELNENHIGREVALMFEANNARKPIIIGLMHVPVTHAAVEVRKEEEILKITAATEIHICCGESSIRMNKNGRIEIRGKDVLSQAARNNRIRGGAIGLN